MKTILEYLNEKKDMAWNNRLCCSKTYGMDAPKEGQEKNFAEAVRDCEIVEELILLVQKNETPTEQMSPIFREFFSKQNKLNTSKECDHEQCAIDEYQGQLHLWKCDADAAPITAGELEKFFWKCVQSYQQSNDDQV